MLSGAGCGQPLAGMAGFDGDPHAYMFSTDRLSADDLYWMWDDDARRSEKRLRAALAEDGLGRRVALGSEDGFVVSQRRLPFDLTEEYGRHTGHAT